jgi:hypothetical protein
MNIEVNPLARAIIALFLAGQRYGHSGFIAIFAK